MTKSSFYTDREAGKWEHIGSIFWSGRPGEEPWKNDNGISSFVKEGYGRVDHKEDLMGKVSTRRVRPNFLIHGKG